MKRFSSVLLLLVFAGSAQAQSSGEASKSVALSPGEATYKGWFNIGAGPPANVGMSYNFGWDQLFYQVGANLLLPQEGDTISALHLGAGKRHVTGPVVVALFAGPALTDVSPFLSGSGITTVGLALNAQALVFFGGFGVGVEGYANINPVQNGMGVRFSFNVNSESFGEE